MIKFGATLSERLPGSDDEVRGFNSARGSHIQRLVPGPDCESLWMSASAKAEQTLM